MTTISVRRLVLALLSAALVLTACGSSARQGSVRLDPTAAPTSTPAPDPTPPPNPPAAAVTAAPIVNPAIPIEAPGVPVPMELQLPTLGVRAPVLAVGKNAKGEMDAPQGPPSSSIWDTVFWYREGAVPGAPGVATIAGHVDDTRVRPRIFARLSQLRAGDGFQIVDHRTGGVAHFHVTESRAIPVEEARTPAVIDRIFGAGAVSGLPEDKARDAADGISHVTLLTCTGSWRHGEFDHRFVAYAVRDS